MNRSRIALAAVAALTISGLTACGNSDLPSRVTGTPASASSRPADDATPPADETTEDSEDVDTSDDDGMVDLGLTDTAKYDGGVEVSLSRFTRGISSEWAAPGNTPYVKFNVTFKNGGDEAADLSGVTLSCQHGDTPGEEIFDSEHGLDGIPTSHVRPGRTVTAVVACEMPKAETYLQVEVQPGLADVTVFSGDIK
ncbi:hypothetical protein ACWEWX_11250 [Streptomyces asiaticus]